MSIPITLNSQLRQALAAQNIAPTEYGPAYNGESAGLDLFNAGPKLVIPSSSRRIIQASAWVDLPQSMRDNVFKTLMPTGLRVALPVQHTALIKERGSISKTPLIARAGVIDPGYTGEIFVNIINLSPVDYVIPAGAKSPFQLLVLPIISRFAVIADEDYNQATAHVVRAGNSIGSTDQE